MPFHISPPEGCWGYRLSNAPGYRGGTVYTEEEVATLKDDAHTVIGVLCTDKAHLREHIEKLESKLRNYQSKSDLLAEELEAAKECNWTLAQERMRAYDVLERDGYRRCDTPACNCGSWHRPDREEPS